MDRNRVALALLGFLLFAITAYVLLNFIASIVFAVFLYYSSRPIYRRLQVFGVHRRIRAVATLLLFALPFLLLLSYTAVLVVGEIQVFLTQTGLDLGSLGRTLESVSGISLPEFTLEGLIEAYRDANYTEAFDTLLQQLQELLSVAVSVVIRFVIMALIVYYLLVDGPRLRGWLVDRFDEPVLDRFLTAVDRDLAIILFGNILNAFLTAFIGITVYYAYNAVAPPPAEIPFPALVGALTGLGSLIPVVGMKIVYWPVGLVMAVTAYLTAGTPALVYVAVFFVVSFVVVDLVPDVVLRPFVSGRNVHMGSLMFAYIMGPLVFGFYGIFLGPIVLVLLIHFNGTVLPFLLDHSQSRLNDFDRG